LTTSLRYRLAARLGLDHARLDRDQIVPLQLLRGLAASGVVVEHLIERYVRRGAMPAGLPDFMTNLGQTGVATFFAISGFIMVYISLRGDRPPPTGPAFLRGRYLRIAPLYYLMTLLIVAFAWATHRVSTDPADRLPSAAEWLLSAAFIPHRGVSGLIQPVYALGWTLHYEMFFYLLFAIGLSLFARRGAYLVLGMIGVLVALGTGIDAPPDTIGLRILAYVFTRPIMGYFAIGIVIALLRHQLWRRLPVLPVPVLAMVLIVALAIATLDLHRATTMAAIATALAATVLPSPERRREGVFSNFSRAFGDASYSIYLTHSFLLGAFASLTASIAARGLPALALMAMLACALCFAAGWLTWRFVELPIAARIRGRRASEVALTAP
jgi:exopolysaccharide production protein ExoZ